ncbi:uncharacterized protein LOC143916246 [Arctopsyche grandis]|uniref:uncharacterized protein LOC143916246 n=1 Tax=Arctopsyche grandis TaxID=121162 RepID=UPI00406D7C65
MRRTFKWSCFFFIQIPTVYIRKKYGKLSQWWFVCTIDSTHTCQTMKFVVALLIIGHVLYADALYRIPPKTSQKYPIDVGLTSSEQRPSALNSIRRYNEEKSMYDRLKKIAYKPQTILRYYYHPREAMRFDYQALVPQTNDYTPVIYNPGLWRGNHGYGFNEWGGQGIV